MEVLKENYRQKYYRILKRQNLSNRNIGTDIAKFSRGVSYKPGFQAKILQNSKETRVFPYTKYSHKYEPTEDEPRKNGKNPSLRGVLKQ